jgi:hypothetical protein
MPDDLMLLDRRITDALAALRHARAAVEHSTNSASVMRANIAECTLNALLDQRRRAGSDHRDMALAGGRGPDLWNAAPSR